MARAQRGAVDGLVASVLRKALLLLLLLLVMVLLLLLLVVLLLMVVVRVVVVVLLLLAAGLLMVVLQLVARLAGLCARRLAVGEPANQVARARLRLLLLLLLIVVRPNEGCPKRMLLNVIVVEACVVLGGPIVGAVGVCGRGAGG